MAYSLRALDSFDVHEDSEGWWWSCSRCLCAGTYPVETRVEAEARLEDHIRRRHP